MMLFWGEGVLRKVVRFVLLVLIVLFCWGWVTNVALGKMNTGQYINKLCADFQQGIKNGSEKASKAANRVTSLVQAWGRPII